MTPFLNSGITVVKFFRGKISFYTVRIANTDLNEAREKLEYMIYHMCKTYGLQLPRRYRRRARKDYLAFAKSRKHIQKQIQSAIRKQLSYVRRDIGYLERYFSQGQSLADRHRMPKLIRNRNIRITPTGSKWNDFSAVTNVAMA